MTALLKKANLSSVMLCNHFSDGLDVDQSWRKSLAWVLRPALTAFGLGQTIFGLRINAKPHQALLQGSSKLAGLFLCIASTNANANAKR
jgi:hypothetical protein